MRTQNAVQGNQKIKNWTSRLVPQILKTMIHFWYNVFNMLYFFKYRRKVVEWWEWKCVCLSNVKKNHKYACKRSEMDDRALRARLLTWTYLFCLLNSPIGKWKSTWQTRFQTPQLAAAASSSWQFWTRTNENINFGVDKNKSKKWKCVKMTCRTCETSQIRGVYDHTDTFKKKNSIKD